MSNVFKTKHRTKRDQSKLFALVKDGSSNEVGILIGKGKTAVNRHVKLSLLFVLYFY